MIAPTLPAESDKDKTIKHEIRNRFTGNVLFTADIPEGTESGMIVRIALEQAVEAGADLTDADLRNANLINAYLSNTNLYGANLCGAKLTPVESKAGLLSKTAKTQFDLLQGDMVVASFSGPRAQAMVEIQHYAAVYGQDGPVEIEEVIRIPVAMPTDAQRAKEDK